MLNLFCHLVRFYNLVLSLQTDLKEIFIWKRKLTKKPSPSKKRNKKNPEYLNYLETADKQYRPACTHGGMLSPIQAMQLICSICQEVYYPPQQEVDKS